ncbi:hypothetical protein [Photorhabdus asymbiotica]|uniref:hypothetical protein n=1 Tax=Photorhabdus asymbiotica TaxID=291112 RepID=UPI003DA7452A
MAGIKEFQSPSSLVVFAFLPFYILNKNSGKCYLTNSSFKLNKVDGNQFILLQAKELLNL